MIKSAAAALCLFSILVQPAIAGWPWRTEAAFYKSTIRVDWQYPLQLPRRFRNHCRYEYFTARPFCSDHCGSDYQFYYCSEISFGCCHLGRGYCDWSALLRCRP